MSLSSAFTCIRKMDQFPKKTVRPPRILLNRLRLPDNTQVERSS